MANLPQKKDIPAPVRAAQEALRILAEEEGGVAAGLDKRLPAFAMQLAKAGEDVTVELLLARARAGELEKQAVPQPEKKTYAEIVAKLPVIAADEDYALIRAAKTGDLELFKRLVAEGADVHMLNEQALAQAALAGHLDIMKYLVEEQGVDVNPEDCAVLMYAAYGGRLNIVKYLIEERGIDAHAENERVLGAAVQMGDLEMIKYLVEEQDADIQPVPENLLKSRQIWEKPDVVKYLAERGVDAAVLKKIEKERLDTHLAACKVWQKVAHVDPPAEELYKENPAYFRREAYESVDKIFTQELGDNWSKRWPFQAAALFGTEDRVLQYLEKWGEMREKFGEQVHPLFRITYAIKLPEKKPAAMNLKAWGDAVLKCGPSMARLVKFADKIPVPEKSDDGRTWSMVKTREKAAQSAYAAAAESPELAMLCMEHDVSEGNFNKALKLLQKIPAVKNIPDIVIDGGQFDMPGAKFRRLAADDIRGLFLGQITDCCQSIGGGGGEECAVDGFTSENSGFYVVENAKGRIVGETWAWRGEKGELVFDSIETLGQNVKTGQWQKLLEAFGDALAKKPGDVTALHVGKGGGTRGSLSKAFNDAVSPAKPLEYKGYRDSHRQGVVWRNTI